MLVQFTVENFLSFDGEVTFSMRASAEDHHQDHLLQRPVAGPLLRAAAIYGANASGKSNLIKAAMFARDLVLRGARPGERARVPCFRLGDPAAADRPSRFQFIFSYGGELYDYGFAVLPTRVAQEWLYATSGRPGAKERRLFERETEGEKTVVKLGDSLAGRSGERRRLLEAFAGALHPNQLFLTEMFCRKCAETDPIHTWFREVLTVIPADAPFTRLTEWVAQREEFASFCGDMLRAAGTGINAVGIREEALEFSTLLPTGFDQGEIDSLVDSIDRDLSRDQVMLFNSSDGKQVMITRGSDDRLLQASLCLMHRAANGDDIPFPTEWESDGTQRMVHLLPMLFTMQTRKECVFLLDELDRRLHPLLSRFILRNVLRSGRGARCQIAFTTHDVDLLDQDLLRRDEVWFVQKEQSGGSLLCSLSEFRIRPDLKLSKGYLAGRFGAVPLMDDLGNLRTFADLEEAVEDEMLAVGAAA